MPRPGPRRPNTAVRMSDEQRRDLDGFAEEDGVTMSDVVRAAIDYYRRARKQYGKQAVE